MSGYFTANIFGFAGIETLKRQYPAIDVHDFSKNERFNHQALRVAIASPHLDVVMFLLERRISLEYNPLVFAMQFGNRGIVDLVFDALLSAGADPFERYNDRTLLHYSVGTQFFERCLKLYKDRVNELGAPSILARAFQQKKVGYIQALKKVGAVIHRNDIVSGWHNVVMTMPEILIESIDSGLFYHVSWADVGMGGKSVHVEMMPILYLSNFSDSLPQILSQAIVFFQSERKAVFIEELKPFRRQLENLCSGSPLLTEERIHIRKSSLYILWRFTSEVCIALAGLHLPALITMTILEEMIGETWPNISAYDYDSFVVKVKHFNEACDHPTKRRRSVNPALESE